MNRVSPRDAAVLRRRFANVAEAERRAREQFTATVTEMAEAKGYHLTEIAEVLEMSKQNLWNRLNR